MLKKDEDTNREKGLKKSKMLVGGQAKLDKNKNNKIDAEDFKILKAEKAKGRGQGLQDEKMKPGKTMAAKKGGMFKGYSKVFETAAKAGQKNTGTSTIVGVKPKLPEASKKSKIARRALRAAKATRLGKIVLPIAAAGVAAQQYLKSKMKKNKDGTPKKKMGGGMMQKYAEGGPAERSPMAEQARRMGKRKAKPGPLGRAGRGVGKATGRKAGIPSLPGKKKKETLGQAQYKTFRSELDTQFKKGQRLQKTYEGASPTIKADMEKRFSGVYKPGEMVSSSRRDTAKTFMRVGGSVTVKTKLGRNKPTKMY